jgi:hypothetical protein
MVGCLVCAEENQGGQKFVIFYNFFAKKFGKNLVNLTEFGQI